MNLSANCSSDQGAEGMLRTRLLETDLTHLRIHSLLVFGG